MSARSRARTRFDAQATADVPLRKATLQTFTRIGAYEARRPVNRNRPFVEGVTLAELADAIAEELAERAGAPEAIVQSGKAEIVTAVGTTVSLSREPSEPPLVVLESANTILTETGGQPGTNDFRRKGSRLQLNAARAGATVKVFYAYARAAARPMFDRIRAVGTTATLSEVPAAEPLVFGIQPHVLLKLTGGAPGTNEYARSNTVLTLNAARAGIELLAVYELLETFLKPEMLSPGGYPTTSATLSETPIAPELVGAFWMPARLPLRYAASSPGTNEFTVSGTTITTGRTMTADGDLYAIVPHA